MSYFFKLSALFNQKCLSALNNEQGVTFSVTQGAKLRTSQRRDAKVNWPVITLEKIMVLLWKPLKENQNWYVNHIA